MASFSERMGFKPIRTTLQLDSMDDVLRNQLWSMVTVWYLDSATAPGLDGNFVVRGSDVHVLLVHLWLYHFGLPVDTLDDYFPKAVLEVRKRFFSAKWTEVYDFIEFVASNSPDESTGASFADSCNHVLERGMSGYRFSGTTLTRITSPAELDEVDQAARCGLQPVEQHIRQATVHLSNRNGPDYRNSIKESISAVEALCCAITNDPNATLGKALDAVAGKTALHPALRSGFSSLYGWTCDEGGIRHALTDGSVQPTFDDAKYMLVSCSAFANYLTAKTSDAGIALGAKRRK